VEAFEEAKDVWSLVCQVGAVKNVGDAVLEAGSAFAGCSRVSQSSGEPVEGVALIVQKLNI
jgi:hypothetical protein